MVRCNLCRVERSIIPCRKTQKQDEEEIECSKVRNVEHDGRSGPILYCGRKKQRFGGQSFWWSSSRVIGNLDLRVPLEVLASMEMAGHCRGHQFGGIRLLNVRPTIGA
jgi:hypothetical protein